MSFFKGNKRGPSDPIITVSAETRATVSRRVKLESQIVEYEADTKSDLIALITRANTGDTSSRCKKGLVFTFDRHIKSGTYSVTDAGFPFPDAYYFETGTFPGYMTFFQYKAKSGSFTVKAIENNTEELNYEISFDFKGVNERNKELKIAGQSTYIVLMEPQQ